MTGLIKCSNPICGLENLATKEFCDVCDSKLPSFATQETVERTHTEEVADAAPTPTQGPQIEDGFCECVVKPIAPEICEDCEKRGIEAASQERDARTQKASTGSPDKETLRSDMPPTLQVRFGNSGVIEFDGSLVVGRGYLGAPPFFSEWINRHTGISRRHCLLLAEDRQISIIDLGSRNGTRVSDASLRPGRPYHVFESDLPCQIRLGRFAHFWIEERA
jgi:FHA domain